MKIIEGTVSFTPEEAGYDGTRLEKLNEHFIEMISKKEIVSGSYCLSRNHKVFVDNAVGKFSCEEDDDRPFTPDTIFGIASITKVFTAVAILKLAEDGKLRLDQGVGEFLDEFNTPPYNTVQIWHLLTHTSGLIADPGVHENGHYVGWWEMIEENKPESWIKAVLKLGLHSKPGEEWSYASIGYMILGELITRISGVHCHQYIEKNIIEPCEMKDTRFGQKYEWADRYNMPAEYRKQKVDQLKRDKKDPDEEDIIPSTGGGIYSTCNDLIKFGNMLLNNGTYNGKRVIGRKALETMRRVHTSDKVISNCWGAKAEPHPYGLGPEVVQADCKSQMITPGTISHEGFGTCCLMIDYEEKFVAVWTAQFYEGDWYAHGLRNVASIIWSGIL
ncbi:serine hydrolase domain-containing protein [Anaeromicropila populeti]|uniref:CubicO group peptidase, beta-lactamase class C family n=1 Tax=Anaeromicropila populeti TaxID=37658 RepID=A0A1I6JQ41_9FIRM|nr:serine hydrolase [Anaeromicropila populeti]SFR80650.1 CubicO group peptidase, beta-lactamase class C family [Anaeromicropila populeti]